MTLLSPRRCAVPRHPAGPVIGWRAWQMRYEELEGTPRSVLGSVGVSAVWPESGPLRAECLSVLRSPSALHHRSPDQLCTCGIYASLSLRRLQRELPKNPYTIMGLALGWGCVEKHRHGWRAEYAAPIAFLRFTEFEVLVPPYSSWPGHMGDRAPAPGPLGYRYGPAEKQALAERHGVPVVDLEEAKRLIRVWQG